MINFTYLKAYLKPTLVRYFLSHVFELGMTLLVIKALTSDDLASFALMSAMIAVIESINLNGIDKLLFKEKLKTRFLWSTFYKLKILGNSVLYSFCILLVLSVPIVELFPIQLDKLLFVTFIIGSFFKVTSHPVVSLGPIYKINNPFILVTFSQKAAPFFTFLYFYADQNADIETLSISMLVGGAISFLVNISYFCIYRPKGKYNSRNYQVTRFWLSNIPNNLLNGFSKNGVFMIYSMILSSSQIANLYIIYRLVRMLLVANSFVKQISLFYLARRKLVWSLQLLSAGSVLVAVILFLVTMIILGFTLLLFMNPSEINSENLVALICLFTATGVYYTNSIIRAQLVVDKRVARLFIGAASEIVLLLFCVLILIIAGLDPYVAILFSLGVSSALTPLVNYSLVLGR